MKRGRVLALAVLLGVAPACAVRRPAEYARALAAGDRAYGAGRMRAAALAYDSAARATARPLDADEAAYRAAHAWQRAGDGAAALARFDRLAARGDARARATRAALEAVRLRYARGARAQAERDAAALVRRAPDSGPARRAVALVLLERDAADPTGMAGLAWIDSLPPTLARTDVGPALAFERAQRLGRAGRTADAVAAWEALLAVPYPRNTRWDDGGLAYARLLVASRRPDDALRVIDRVLAVRESTAIVPGSTQRPRFAELQLLRARVLRDELRRPADAADAFHAVYAGHPTSLLRDDALLEEAEARTLAGDAARACRVYATLALEFPCTRRGRTGSERARACGADPAEAAARACRRAPAAAR